MSLGASMRRGLSWPRRFVAFWVRHLQQGTASLGEIWRNPTSSLMTITVIGVCLALLVSFHLVIQNVRQAVPSWQQTAQINVFVSPDTDSDGVAQLSEQIRAMPSVEHVKLVSKAQGLQEFKQNSGFGKALDLLGSNPLPDLLIVTPNANQRQSGQLQLLQSKLATMVHVDQARLDTQWLTRLENIISIANQVLQLLIGLLLVSIVLTVGNTIRLNVLSQRNEIEVMKLIGATNAFIQRPFLYTGFWYGFIGGLLAWLLSNIMMLYLGSALSQLASLYEQDIYLAGLSVSGFIDLMLFSSLLGLLSSWFSVSRYVKTIEPR
ncbi:permease-like cell division protein FtsX [Celerinatantimonas yamalensis]|uniref:Cell division protein FtsX n=1 Tax=Celerinatantimonas yamalensis TaxID=559956 RepID=A0ABW9G7J5_9GAMM